MKTIYFLFILFFIFINGFANLANAGGNPYASRVLKTAYTTSPPKIDGILNDECWKTAVEASDFITSEPSYGKSSHQKTVCKIVYDNTAVYVYAYMYDTLPGKITHQLCGRDEDANDDFFGVAFDCYDDDLNALIFFCTVDGVQGDFKITPNDWDRNWDAVWESKATCTIDGWCVEMKIPLSALRFPKKPVQQWGLNFHRFIQRDKEWSSWTPANPEMNGDVSQFGSLTGIQNVTPPLRLSLLPYISVGYQQEPISTNPAVMSGRGLYSGGMDLKYGINESYTLDMTLVPDFTQVQSDKKVRNLSPFEQRFDEHRPFFTEGAELFAVGDMFYSRRIGGIPRGHDDVYNYLQTNESVKENPNTTQLLNATKLSGKTKSNLGIGVINAVTKNMYAEIINDSTDARRKVQTDVLTNYNIFVLNQSLKNNSSLIFSNANVMRNGNQRDANVSQVIFNFKNKKLSQVIKGHANISYVNDTSLLQKEKTGYNAKLVTAKINGKFRYTISDEIMTSYYDPNDLGINYETDFNLAHADVSFNQFKPAHFYNNYGISTGGNYSNRLSTGQFKEVEAFANAAMQFKNFWFLEYNFYTKPITFNDFYEPRVPGYYYSHVGFWFNSISVVTDSRKKIFLNLDLEYAESPLPNDPYKAITLQPTMKLFGRSIITYTFKASKDKGNWGYVDRFTNANNEVVPVFGRRTINSIVNAVDCKLAVNAAMYMNLTVRHYWNQLQYDHFYNLQTNGTLIGRNDWANMYDENFNLWNIDFNYTWRFAPGSDIIFTWKNFISERNSNNKLMYYDNFSRTLRQAQTNTVAVKVIYYLDYLKLKKKGK